MPDPGPDLLIRSIKRTLAWLTVATVVVYLALAGVTVWTRYGAEKNRKALCALRSDLQQRIDGSTQFLREHPRGVAGIPAKTILDGIANQRRTIKALSGIAC